MSNKIVPQIYRTVIDDVIDNIKHEFEEYGVAEDVLADLQAKWESKVIASRVAEFEAQPASHHAQPQQVLPQQHAAYPHPMQMLHAYAPPHVPYAAGRPPIKNEPGDNPYALSAPYSQPSLPGPQLNGLTKTSPVPPHTGGQTSVLSFPPGPPPTLPTSNGNAGTPIGRPYVPPAAASSSTSTSNSSGGRMPQLDGASSLTDSDEDSPSPLSYAPRSSHPSLPQPQSQPSVKQENDDEAINSDLDDSDTDGEEAEEEGGVGETDIVFCTYDKVARVKNKWKCILKDGMIHVNGRDYLFQKCSGEFEW